ncbi:Phage capsid and scaffolding protein [Yersinia phage fPS-50]|uniref:Phage capsid and scaffolding protein n=2 Tax=Helsettvirus fPS9 TaxID=2733625 RepID=A0A2D0PE11_9CAUD|nr:Phage capsid and scaffolding protein [Yersinia phage fPS-52]SOO46717.1 Phage capsid and scaffolding protein [Yersinia phage fPS-50]
MSNESNADVYAEMGANPTAVTGSMSDHDTSMLELDVDTRDGDDRITLVDNDDPYNTVDPFADPEEDDGTRNSLRISSEGNEDIDSGEGEPDESQSEEATDFEAIGDVPSELTEASAQLEEHEAGFQEMVDAAAERGLSVDAITRIQSEYQGDGLTKESYEELAAAGYSKSFVDSYIRGQEALVESYVKSVFAYAGGEQQFNALYTHLEATNAEAAQSLVSALESRDLSTVKAIVNLAGASRAKTFGKPAARSVTKQARQSAPVSNKVVGYTNSADMMKDMNDPRYSTDAKFRKEVELKTMYSTY